MAFNLVNFKKGTLAGLESLKTNSGVEEGTFYLTIDNAKNTSRLFIGTSSTTALPVNSNIVVVTSVDDLTNAHATNFNDGDFAYVTTGNILAVRYNGVWTQINAPDSKTVKDLTASVATSGGVATITWTLRDQSNNVIHTSDSTSENLITPNITMTGVNGVSVSGTGTAVTVTGTSYEMNSAAVVENSNTAIIKLQSKDSASATAADVSSITVSAGDNVSITGTANNIVIAATDTHLNSNSLTIANVGTALGTGFNITVKDSGNNQDTAKLDPKITLGTHTASGEQIGFLGGVANLPVYTKDEIDSMNKSLNALVYRGTIGTNGTISTTVTGTGLNKPESSIKIGYTYKLLGDSTTVYQVPTIGKTTTPAYGGDLIIANGTEGSNGYINRSIIDDTLYFDIIPSGDDISDYTLEPATHGVTLEEGGVAKGSFTLDAGTQISLTDNATGDDRTVTIAHSDVVRTDPTATTVAQTNGSDQTFTAVTGVTSNTQGHITAVQTASITIKDSVAAMSSVASTASAANNVATVTTTVGLTPYTGATASTANGSFKIESDNLSVTAPSVSAGAAPEIKINLVWGTI